MPTHLDLLEQFAVKGYERGLCLTALLSAHDTLLDLHGSPTWINLLKFLHFFLMPFFGAGYDSMKGFVLTCGTNIKLLLLSPT